MNTEKLDSLASQAGFDVGRLRTPHPGGFSREDMLALESFAELIVKECADYVQFYYKDHMCEVIAHDMKTHFGVE